MHNIQIQVKVATRRSQKTKSKWRKHLILKGTIKDMSNTYTVLPPLGGAHNKVMELEWFWETQHSEETPS